MVLPGRTQDNQRRLALWDHRALVYLLYPGDKGRGACETSALRVEYYGGPRAEQALATSLAKINHHTTTSKVRQLIEGLRRWAA